MCNRHLTVGWSLVIKQCWGTKFSMLDTTITAVLCRKSIPHIHHALEKQQTCYNQLICPVYHKILYTFARRYQFMWMYLMCYFLIWSTITVLEFHIRLEMNSTITWHKSEFYSHMTNPRQYDTYQEGTITMPQLLRSSSFFQNPHWTDLHEINFIWHS